MSSEGSSNIHDSTSQNEKHHFIEQGSEFASALGECTLRVQHWMQESDGIRATLCLQKGADIIQTDRVFLDSSRSRQKYLEGCPESIRSQVASALLELHDFLRVRLSKNGKPQTPAAAAALSSEEEKEALQLLSDPKLLLKFLVDTVTLGVVGENENKTTLFLGYTSRKLENPINLVVKGESSAGKNRLTDSVADFIPPEDIIRLTSATTKALFYTDTPIKNKVVSIAERVGSEDSDYAIRTMQSEKKIVFWSVQKGEDGRITTVEKSVDGPAAFVETTTKTHLHPENETRTFDLYIDESEEQTARIHEVQNKIYDEPPPPGFKDAILKKWHNAQRLLKPCHVLIPFARQIPFPTKPIRVRRDRPRFMTLIEVSAFLHQYQREQVEKSGVHCIIASQNDYLIARELGAKLLENILAGVTPKCKLLVQKAEEMPSGEFKRADLEKLLDWDKKTVEKYAHEAIRLGCLEGGEPGGGKGRFKTYRFVKPIQNVEILLPEKLEEVK